MRQVMITALCLMLGMGAFAAPALSKEPRHSPSVRRSKGTVSISDPRAAVSPSTAPASRPPNGK